MAITITIIGLDALGQSLGLALKASTVPVRVILHDRDHNEASEAKKRGVGDAAEWNLPAAVSEADLVFVNEPLRHLRETFEVIGPLLRADAVVTDTASVKEVVLRWAGETLPPTVHFVGGTPLVTATAPNARLFQKRRYAVVPQPHTAEAAVRLLTDVVTLLGAEPLFIEPSEHESLLAAVQHLPALTSAALLQLTAGSQSWKEMATMASPTYAIATALPTTDPQALSEMLYHNREPLLHWLGALRQELGKLQELLHSEDEHALEAHLTKLVEVQARWRKAEAQNPDLPNYEASMKVAEDTRGFKRWFGFGGRRED